MLLCKKTGAYVTIWPDLTVVVDMWIIRHSRSPIRKGDTYGTNTKSAFLRKFNALYTHHKLNHLKVHISLSYPNKSSRRITKRESKLCQITAVTVRLFSKCLNITIVGYLLHLFTKWPRHIFSESLFSSRHNEAGSCAVIWFFVECRERHKHINDFLSSSFLWRIHTVETYVWSDDQTVTLLCDNIEIAYTRYTISMAGYIYDTSLEILFLKCHNLMAFRRIHVILHMTCSNLLMSMLLSGRIVCISSFVCKFSVINWPCYN